jgi:hypothetical protein
MLEVWGGVGGNEGGYKHAYFLPEIVAWTARC